MGGVRVDPDKRRAAVAGGALLGTMDRATEPHGLATTAGKILHTGVGGLTLGGGFGWLARQFGMSCDNVESYEVVTAAGDIVRASATEHPDLYWGLRGGGGNFGVVTEFVFRLHAIPGTALMVDLTFDVADGVRPVERWRDLLPDAPRPAVLNSSVGTDADGRSVVSLGYVWAGTWPRPMPTWRRSGASAPPWMRGFGRFATLSSRPSSTTTRGTAPGAIPRATTCPS